MSHRIYAHGKSANSLDGKVYYSAHCLCGWEGPWLEEKRFTCKREVASPPSPVGTWREEAVRLGKALNGAVVVGPTVVVGSRYVRAIMGRTMKGGMPLLGVQQSADPSFGPHRVQLYADSGDQYQLRCSCGWSNEWSKEAPKIRVCPMRPARCVASTSFFFSPSGHSLSVTEDGCYNPGGPRQRRVSCSCGWLGRPTRSELKIADRLRRGCPQDRESAENKVARAGEKWKGEPPASSIAYEVRTQMDVGACQPSDEAARISADNRRRALRETTIEQALADMTAREQRFRQEYEIEVRRNADMATKLRSAEVELYGLRKWRENILDKLFNKEDTLAGITSIEDLCKQAFGQISLLQRIAGERDKAVAWIDSALALIFGSKAAVGGQSREQECEQAFGAIRAMMSRVVKS